MKKIFTPLAVLLLTSCSVLPSVEYSKPAVPDNQLSLISINNNSMYTPRVTGFQDPVDCKGWVVRKIEGNYAFSDFKPAEKFDWYAKKDTPVSFLIEFYQVDSITKWREVKTVVTFVPQANNYRLILGAKSKNSNLDSAGFSLYAVENDQLTPVSDSQIVRRNWKQDGFNGKWCFDMTPQDYEKLNIPRVLVK